MQYECTVLWLARWHTYCMASYDTAVLYGTGYTQTQTLQNMSDEYEINFHAMYVLKYTQYILPCPVYTGTGGGIPVLGER